MNLGLLEKRQQLQSEGLLEAFKILGNDEHRKAYGHRSFTQHKLKIYFMNAYKISVIALSVFVLLVISTTSNLPIVHADTGAAVTNVKETRGILTITQEGTSKLIRSPEGPAAEHLVSVSISGNYTFSSQGLKIDMGSLSGKVTIDDDQPIKLSIQKITIYKDMKTLFYKAMFVDKVGSVSGKLKFTSPLNFESDNTQKITVSALTPKIDSVRYYSKTTTGDISIRSSGPSSTLVCDQSLWNHVYNPTRLTIIDPCKIVSGIIEEIRDYETDGDYHILLKLDPQYANLINSVNMVRQKGDLVVEPICQHKVTQEDAKQACKGFSSHVIVPPVGTHVKVTGTYVLDGKHGGWYEIHPVTSMERLDH